MKKRTAVIFAVFLCAQAAYGMGKKPETINQEKTRLFNVLEKRIHDLGEYGF